MKKALTAFLLFITVCFTHAQTKVFKEVSEDISSQVRPIYQDNSLVGYIVFTQLEKASADSFNYKITIMDENLNDIGVVKFKENKLILHTVTFEQDVLCLAYFKSNFYNNEFPGKKAYEQAVKDEKSYVFTQFVGLDGKIIKTNAIPVQIGTSQYSGKFSRNSYVGIGSLNHDIQARNVPGKGFAVFFGEERKNNLVVFNATGDRVWQKTIKETARKFSMLTSDQDIYMLIKKEDAMSLGGYELLGYKTNDSTASFKHALKDKRGNSLSIFSFANDPATGKPYISGGIIDPGKGNDYGTPRTYAKGVYAGVYTINFNGYKKSDISEVYSYWNDGSQSLMSERGRLEESGTYVRYAGSYKDFQGNTFFYGSSYIKRTKYGSIASTIITLPTIFIPVYISMFGYTKNKLENTVLIKQNGKGALTLDNSVEGDKSNFQLNKLGFGMLDTRGYLTATNPETKNIYLIIDDKKTIFIYSMAAKKVVRTIPHAEGNTTKHVMPAKEGHIMISEYNRKERFTTVSIEAL